jgi:hypothetical protein
MNEQEELFEYNEEAAVAFIRNHLSQELKEKFSDDDIYYILDVIRDFYENKGWDVLNDEDEEKELHELIKYIVERTMEDKKGSYDPEDVAILLRVEAAYVDTLDLSF